MATKAQLEKIRDDGIRIRKALEQSENAIKNAMIEHPNCPHVQHIWNCVSKGLHPALADHRENILEVLPIQPMADEERLKIYGGGGIK